MLSIIKFDQAAGVCADKNISKFMISLAIDTMEECQLFKVMASKYPDLDEKFNAATNGKSYKPGDVVEVRLATGHIIYFMMIRTIEKFQPYVLDITSAIDRTFDIIKRHVDSANPSKIFIPLPNCDELKMSDALILPMIIDHLNVKDLDVYVASDGSHEDYLEKISNDIIYWKRDSWKTDWMLSLDDILFVEILATVINLTHSFKLSRSSINNAYHVCHKNGMFPKFEFYSAPWGGMTFKLLLPKCMGLMNHGLILNAFQYSKMDPPKTSFSLGPSYPLLKHLAYTILAENRDKVTIIAKEVKKEYLDSYQERKTDPVQNSNGFKQSYNRSEKTNPSFTF